MKSQTSLSALNIGQSAIIAIAVTLIMWRATVGVVNGSMTIGDLVLVNAFMIQLYIPLNFLGVIYREIKQALADMERLFGAHRGERGDPRQAGRAARSRRRGAEVRFEHVDFAYEPNRQILFDVSFAIPAGRTVAVVGPSGSGKSTLARLLYRFYDVTAGASRVDGQDIRDVSRQSLRALIGIVPQDTVLFNDTHRIQHRLRAARRDRKRRSSPRRGSRRSTTSSRAARGLRDHGGRARPQALRAARSSAWRSPGRSSSRRAS